MAENSKIEWTDHTFNPWMGCTKVSPACANCYAERDMDHRYGKVNWGPIGTRVLTSDTNWQKPKQWNHQSGKLGIRYRVFCASLADVFEDWQGPIVDSRGCQVASTSCFRTEPWLPIVDPKDGAYACCVPITMDDVRRRLFELIDATPNLDWLLLTKRPENILRMWPQRTCCGYNAGGIVPHCSGCGTSLNYRKNVWLGTSVENQEYADKRIPELLKCRDLAQVLFLSCEPLVGLVDLTRVSCVHDKANMFNALDEYDGDPVLRKEKNASLDWIITGGESGPNARWAHPDWYRSLRDQCADAGVPFHFKQWGEFGAERVRVGKKNAGRLLDGRTHDGLPALTPAAFAG